MKYTFEYTTQEERTDIINSNQGKYLIEERNIREGNFLIFTDVKPLEVEVQELNNRTQATEDALLAIMMMGGM